MGLPGENICKQFRLPIADLTKKELSGEGRGGDVWGGDVGGADGGGEGVMGEEGEPSLRLLDCISALVYTRQASQSALISLII